MQCKCILPESIKSLITADKQQAVDQVPPDHLKKRLSDQNKDYAGQIRYALVHCFFCFIGFALAFSASPRPAAQSGNSFKIRMDVDMATAEVSVVDKKGNPVPNLKKQDFQLYEDGRKQEILLGRAVLIFLWTALLCTLP